MIRLSYKTIPTHDLYFRHPLRDLISERLLDGRRPIRRLGDNCFVAKDQLVILRYLTREEERKVTARQWRTCYYVIDDDFATLDHDRSIPEDYRQRMLRFRETRLPAILRLADKIVAPNPRIFAHYPDKPHLLLDPCAMTICQDFSHFEDGKPLRILFPGTRSHLGDLAFLSDSLLRLCRERPDLELVTYFGGYAPAALCGLPNIQHRRSLGWSAYRKVMAKERFHLCLAPALDTPFNQARSINKLFDCAAFGAAGLFSPVGPVADALGEQGRSRANGTVIDNDAALWETRLRAHLSDRAGLLSHAKALSSLACEIGNPDHVRQFWRQHLQLD